MADPNQALATQLSNIQQKTGKSLSELTALIHAGGLTKHGEIVAMLKQTLGLGHGDANTLAHVAKQPQEPTDDADPLAAIYTGKKAALRPIHDALLAVMSGFGDFEAAPKKGYISYRRRKQFAMIGPATQTQVELGLSVKGLDAGERLQALPAGQMCNFRARLSDVAEVDDALQGWLRAAWEASA